MECILCFEGMYVKDNECVGCEMGMVVVKLGVV